jgi:hypothetical protein
VTGLLDVLGIVIAALERSGVPYSIGGSLASSFAGEPRASLDADVVVALTQEQVAPFVSALGSDFYADEGALHRAVALGSSTNLIHHATGIKIDLFIASSPLDRQQLARRRPVSIQRHNWFIHSPEDILIQKLLWYRKSGESSERQWRDVLGIVLVQGRSLDRGYLTQMAAPLELTGLLERAWREGERGAG